jgi:hypothetical protein
MQRSIEHGSTVAMSVISFTESSGTIMKSNAKHAIVGTLPVATGTVRLEVVDVEEVLAAAAGGTPLAENLLQLGLQHTDRR